MLSIPGFDMIEKLGQGGMSTVWKARQLTLDRIVAIKIMSSKLISDPDDVKMFLHEAQSTAKLKHPGIIQVYDANVQDGVYYYVMEFVAGYTIGDWIRRKGRLSDMDALTTAECVADALAYAWDKERIIHCDIKPDNVIVDSDGTVKISDLGLSRTISAMTGGTGLLDEIMGTSAYMSPEQVQGRADLDCRSDIYSLGSMLYYMVTGKQLFDNHSDDEIMEMQLSETVPDPLEINPDISKSVCWLIEKMLMKDREHRHNDWTDVLTDIARAKSNLPPQAGPPPEGKSTTRRSRLRTPDDFLPPPPPTAPVERRSHWAVILLLAIIAGSAVGAYFMLKPGEKPVAHQSSSAIPQPQPVPRIIELPADKNAKEMFEFAATWASDNPAKYDEIVNRFQTVMIQTKGTKYSLMAEDEIKKAASARQAAVDDVLRQIEVSVADQIRNNQFTEAAGKYETYSGSLATESEEPRKAVANELRERQEAFDKANLDREKQKEDDVAHILDNAVAMLSTGGIAQARDSLTKALADPSLAGKTDKLKTLDALLGNAIELDVRIMNSFIPQIGKTVVVEMVHGEMRSVIINDMTDGKVTATQNLNAQGAIIKLTFGIDDLAPREKLVRLGTDDTHDVALGKGIIALDSKNYVYARKYFGMTDPTIAEKLVALVNENERKSVSEEAEKALSQIMKLAGISVGTYDRDIWLAAISSKKLPPGGMAALCDSIAVFKAKYGITDFGRQAEPVLAALAHATGQEDSFTEKTSQHIIVALPPEIAAIKGNTKAVIAMLVKKNPGLEETQIKIQTDKDGKTSGLEILYRNCDNIWPVAALPDLKTFSYREDGEPGLLKDITPLRGLELENIALQNCKVADISPLSQMPLRHLSLEKDAGVRDISALNGMKLESLNLSGTKVFDLLPLAAMQLTTLNLNDTQVKDLAIVKDMPLTQLDIANTRIHDFSFLKDLKQLHFLNANGTQFKNVEFLSALPIETLLLQDTAVNSISALRGMRINSLEISRTPVKDFSVIATLPLNNLNVTATKFKELELLAGMESLTSLYIGETEISDISPLKALKLKTLNIENTRISDISPLKGMELDDLWCRKTNVKNFQSLAGMPLKRIWLDEPFKRPQLRKIFPQLKFINWVRFGN